MTSGSRIAFIGLGVMGAPMARNLIAAGFDICVHDAVPAVLDTFADEPCDVARNPREAVNGRDMVITILPDSAIVREVLLGVDGAVGAAAPDALIMEMSTGSVPALKRLGADIAAIGRRLIDAPVGRSRREAATGNLLVMAGGDPADIAEARPVLDVLGDTIVHAGPLGTGLTLKLVNNYMSMVNHVLTGEVLAFARKAGLDLKTAVDTLSTTSAGRGQLLTNFPAKVLAGDVSPDFPISMGIKDLDMALELAAMAGAPCGFGDLARSLFERAAANGRSAQDCTAILHDLEERAGLAPTAPVAGTANR